MAFCSKNKIICFIQVHQDVTTFIIFVHSELVSILYFNYYSRISDVYGRNTRQDGLFITTLLQQFDFRMVDVDNPPSYTDARFGMT